MARFLLPGIAALIVWAYLPALDHAPRHDQLGYLAETACLAEAPRRPLIASAMMNRERSFMAADRKLFRPLLYVWMEAQRRLFGYDTAAWQAVSLGMHLLVGFALFRLLTLFHPGIPATAGTAFFLSMPANIPMAAWHHVSGYMVFLCLLLTAARAIFFFSRENSGAHLWYAALLLLPACFCFEAGALFSWIAALLLGWSGRSWRTGMILAAPGLMYGAVYLVVLTRGPMWEPEAGAILVRFFSWPTLAHAGTALGWSFLAGVFASARDIVPLERIVLSPATLMPHWPLGSPWPYLFRGTVMILMVSLLTGLAGWSQEQPRRRFAVLTGLWLFAFAVLIAAGRMNTRGLMTGLLFNSYYIYFFWALGLPLFFAAVAPGPEGKPVSVRLLRAGAVAVLGAMIVVNVVAVRSANAMIALKDAPRRQLLSYLDGVTQRHRGEPDFSFSISSRCPGNYPGRWLHRVDAPLWRRETLASALFPEYSRPRQGKYRLACPGEGEP